LGVPTRISFVEFTSKGSPFQFDSSWQKRIAVDQVIQNDGQAAFFGGEQAHADLSETLLSGMISACRPP
jgi:hypothetical protein